ncbi:MAG: HEAT repeat domain-containing protein [Caldilineaceae bacterium]|nr:HEAT repeat domain-containing protein [Caldilineaceae bacterium]
MKLLNDSRMQEFIVNGYVKVKAAFTPAFHESVRAQVEEIFSTTGNPGNDILPAIPQLADLFSHPAVTGALTSILGPGYAMHPHRHCHLTPPRQAGQRHHQDSYEDDQNVRHHRTRWVMAFYYPQDVNVEMGPTSVLPASQYYTRRDQAEKQEEVLLSGEAGAVTIVHYDLWHRAATNHSDRNRYMIKFLFCRMAEPNAPSWQCASPVWSEPAAYEELPRLWRSVWNWHLGNELRDDGQDDASRVGVSAGRRDNGLRVEQEVLSEAGQLENVYQLSGQGPKGSAELCERLSKEALELLDHNQAARHTNPSQLYSGFGLSAQGATAVPYLLELLRTGDWPLRAAVADILGDIGRPAGNAVPFLIDSLDDDSEWVRRNAAEALGNIGSAEPVPQLARLLVKDSCRFVRHNAALSLAKIGRDADAASSSLQMALDDTNLYVRENARLALARIHME